MRHKKKQKVKIIVKIKISKLMIGNSNYKTK